jgi:hypothetical protein
MVIDPQTVDRLHAIVRRETLSLLMYVGQAFPWTTVKQVGTLAELKRIIDEERAAIASLGLYLTRRRAPVPWLGSYPSDFTTINFLSLEYLLPRLVDFERSSLAQLEKDLPAIHDTEAMQQMGKLVQMKREHLRELELLALPKPASA